MPAVLLLGIVLPPSVPVLPRPSIPVLPLVLLLRGVVLPPSWSVLPTAPASPRRAPAPRAMPVPTRGERTRVVWKV